MKDYWNSLSIYRKIKFIISIVISIYVLIFAFINLQETEINFIFFKVKISITLLILICLILGYLTSNIFDFRKYRSNHKEINQLKTKIKDLEEKN
jgi:uncharacterized integral membrane protein